MTDYAIYGRLIGWLIAWELFGADAAILGYIGATLLHFASLLGPVAPPPSSGGGEDREPEA